MEIYLAGTVTYSVSWGKIKRGQCDPASGQEVMMRLHDITRNEGCSVIFVTHDPRVEAIASRILWLEDGSLRDRQSEQHAWVRDPICGMRVDEWTATLFSENQGNRYAFCSKRCLERFRIEPEKYLQ